MIWAACTANATRTANPHSRARMISMRVLTTQRIRVALRCSQFAARASSTVARVSPNPHPALGWFTACGATLIAMADPTLLLVDDEDNLRSMLEAALRHSGFEVHCAASGRSAIEVATGVRPDLIVLDVMLPDLDGFEVCRRLRQDGVGPERWAPSPPRCAAATSCSTTTPIG